MRLKKVSGWWWNSVENWHFCPNIWIGYIVDAGDVSNYKDHLYLFVGWLKGHFVFHQEQSNDSSEITC